MAIETVAAVPEVRTPYDEMIDEIKAIKDGAWGVFKSAEGKVATIRSGLNAAAARAEVKLQHKVRDDGKTLYTRVKPEDATKA